MRVNALSVSANGLWNVFTGRKKWTITCGKCHIVNGKGKQVGPELTGIGAIQTPEYFLESILTPSAKIVKGYETM